MIHLNIISPFSNDPPTPKLYEFWKAPSLIPLPSGFLGGVVN